MTGKRSHASRKTRTRTHISTTTHINATVINTTLYRIDADFESTRVHFAHVGIR